MTIVRPVTKRLPESSFVLDDSGPFPLGFVILPFGDRSDIHRPVQVVVNRKDTSLSRRGQSRLERPEAKRQQGGQEGVNRGNVQGEEYLGWNVWDRRDTKDNTHAFEQLEDEPPSTLTPLLSAALVARCTHCGALHNPCNIDLVPTGFGVVCGLCGRVFDPFHVGLQRRDRAFLPFFGGKAGGSRGKMGIAATLSSWVSYIFNDDEDEDESMRASDNKKGVNDYNIESYGRFWEQLYRRRQELASRSRYNRGPHLQMDQRRRRQHERLSENPIIDIDDTYPSSRREQSDHCELDETKYHVIEYALPIGASSRLSSTSSSSSPHPLYEVPAIECPPLVAVCIDGSSARTSSYYEAIAACISKSILPPTDSTSSSPSSPFLILPAVLAIFVFTEGGGVSVFDLTSPVPHLKHVMVAVSPNDDANPQPQKDRVVPIGQAIDVRSAFVPVAHPLFRPNVEAAIRALEDHTATIDQACTRREGTGKIHLASSLHAVLDFLQDVGAVHPGISHESPDGLPPCNFPGRGDSFCYAGGKIMCFLGGPPSELAATIEEPRSKRNKGKQRESQDDPEKRAKKEHLRPREHDVVGTGGFGGSYAPVGQRFEMMDASDGIGANSSRKSISVPSGEPAIDDIESGGLGKDTHHDEDEDGDTSAHQKDSNLKLLRNNDAVNEMYKELGSRCALAALGVETFVILEPPQEQGDHDSGDGTRGASEEESAKHQEYTPYLGVPTLHILTDQSGGGSPLLFRLPFGGHLSSEELEDENISSAPGGTVGCLIREVKARCPWGRPTAFGGLLRVRMSPTIRVDTSDLFTLDWLKPAKPTRNNLFSGPCAESPDGDDLVILGTCDATTALSIDIEVGTTPGGPVYNGVRLEERGDLNLPPCVQTSFAYTAVVARRQPGSPTETISYSTVRRLRVVTSNVGVAMKSETLTESLDMEVLALVLFRKVWAAACSAGLEEARRSTMDWLLSALASTYRSAELYASESKESKDRLGGNNRPPQHVVTSFIHHDRLLARGEHSSLSSQDILLARGHERLCDLPLIVFSMLQCDALRPAVRGAFQPSMDARYAAAANMLGMAPWTLFRSLVPNLSLWHFQGENGDTGAISLEVAMDGIDPSMDAVRFAIRENGPGAQTSPPSTSLLLVDSPRQISLCLGSVVDTAAVGSSLEPSTSDIASSSEVHRLLDVCCQSYRDPPPVRFALETENGGMVLSRTSCLEDALVGDSVLRIRVGGMGNSLSFQEWCCRLADAVYEDIFRERKDKNEDSLVG